MVLRIITPEMRQAEPRGVRILVTGAFGVGKTSLLLGLPPDETVVADVENGLLPVAHHPSLHVRIQTWSEFEDFNVRIAGPDPSRAPHEPLSQAHYDRVGGRLPDIENRPYIFIDTLSALAGLSFRHALQLPENVSERTGKLSLRDVYGSHARQCLGALHHLQRGARGHSIIMTAGMDSAPDEFGRIEHRLQAEGQRVPREIGGIFDISIVMNFVDFGDGKLVRALICTSPNAWNYPSKDRSGKLDMVEPPDLGRLIAKILPARARHRAVPVREELTAATVPFQREQTRRNMMSNGSGSGLGLDRASSVQGRELIPSGTVVELVMTIRPGSIGEEGLCKRSANGQAEMFDAVCTVRGGPWDGVKIYDSMIIKGSEPGHAIAADITFRKLRAIFEAIHGLDPNDSSEATRNRRNNATLSGFHGATFLATIEIEVGGKRPDGSNYKDKNVLGKILRVGDANYRRLDQPAPMPVPMAAPAQPSPAHPTSAAPASVRKPPWAE